MKKTNLCRIGDFEQNVGMARLARLAPTGQVLPAQFFLDRVPKKNAGYWIAGVSLE